MNTPKRANDWFVLPHIPVTLREIPKPKSLVLLYVLQSAGIALILLCLLQLSTHTVAYAQSPSNPDNKAQQIELHLINNNPNLLAEIWNNLICTVDTHTSAYDCNLQYQYHLVNVSIEGYNQNGEQKPWTEKCDYSTETCPTSVTTTNYWWSGKKGAMKVSLTAYACTGPNLLIPWSKCVLDPTVMKSGTLNFTIAESRFPLSTCKITYDVRSNTLDASDCAHSAATNTVPSPGPGASTSQPTPQSTEAYATVAVPLLNVRNGPGINYTKIGELNLRDRVRVTFRNSDCTWLLMPGYSSDAWIYASSTNLNLDCNSLPIFTSIPQATAIPIATIAPTTAPTAEPPSASINFWADSTELQGGCTTVRWTVDNVLEVYYEGQGVEGHGSRQVCPATTQTYRLRVVQRSHSEELRSVTVTVRTTTQPTLAPIQPTQAPVQTTPAPAQASVNFWADRTSILQGECIQIFWDVINVNEVYLDGEGVAGAGSRSVCPLQSQTYTLRVVLRDQSRQDQEVVINVQEAAANNPPLAPSLLGPDDWAVFRGNQPTLCAGHNGDPENDGINEFHFMIYESAQNWDSGWISADCVAPPPLGYYEFKWRAQVRDTRGAESSWSEPRHYNVYEEYQQSANAPTLSEPDDWAELQGTMPRLCVNANGDINGQPASQFLIVIFESAHNWESGWSSERCQTPPSLGPATFHWHAKARNSAGEETSWSPQWNFTVREQFVTSSNSPKLNGPDNWAELQNQTPQLCARYEGAFNGKTVTALRFVIYESAQGWDSEWVSYGSGDLCVQPPNLDHYTFKWHVRGRTDDGQETDWSESWNFSIRP